MKCLKINGHTIVGDRMSIYLQLLLASVLWGSNVIVMKLLLEHVPFLLLATLRVFLSLIFLGAYMLIKHISFFYTSHKKTMICGFIAIYINFFLTFLGMQEVKGIDNAFLNALAPVLTFIFSVIFLHQKGHYREYISILLCVFAFLLSIRFQLFSIKIGFFYLVLGLSSYLFSYILIQKWNLEKNIVFTFYQLLFGLICLFIHCLLVGQFDLSGFTQISFVEGLTFIIVSGIGFAYIQVIYMKSIDCIGALKTSSFLSINPIITYIESIIILNESFDWIHFLSFVIIIGAVKIMNKSQFS